MGGSLPSTSDISLPMSCMTRSSIDSLSLDTTVALPSRATTWVSPRSPKRKRADGNPTSTRKKSSMSGPTSPRKNSGGTQMGKHAHSCLQNSRRHTAPERSPRSTPDSSRRSPPLYIATKESQKQPPTAMMIVSSPMRSAGR